MNPQHDPNPQPAAAEAAAADHIAENSNVESSPAMEAHPAPAMATSSSGAATAAVRAPAAPLAEEETPSANDPAPTAVAAEPALPPAELSGANDPSEANAASTETGEAHETSETSETMDQLLDQFAVPEPVVAEGEIFDGRVIAVTDAGVIVDVGGKFEGFVPAQEFVDSGSPIEFGKGQTIEVERLHEQKDGYVLLSHVRAHRRRVWERIEKSYREHSQHHRQSHRANQGRPGGGYRRARFFAGFANRTAAGARSGCMEGPRHRSPRPEAESQARQRCRQPPRDPRRRAESEARDLDGALSEGAIVTGRVKNVTDYGVFVDLGGMDGLLHMSDMVWGRVPHPSSVVKPGEEIEVQILKFDKEKQRISLGRKQLLPDPWATVPERFPVGTRVHGKIVGVTDYGAFVQIEPGVEGLVHVSEMSWSKRTKHPSKMVKVGDDVEVVVLEVKTDQRRISLGLKQTMPDPWEAAAEKYPVGTIVNGRIRNLAEFGAFVEIEEGMEGLIHISDISWTERIKHPSEKFKKGDTVEAKVLKVDSQNRRLSLGIKQVNDIWANWFAEHKIGDVVKGKVVRTTDFGAFVELAEGIEGLCHVSEIEERQAKGRSRQGKAGSRRARHFRSDYRAANTNSRFCASSPSSIKSA